MTTPTDPARVRAILAARARHGRRTRRVTAVLLALWCLTTVATVCGARALAQVTVFGWPLSFYLAAQGTALIYLALIGAYNWHMARLDARYRADLAP
jgi:putative solute:sodium symporter small subunit